MDNYKKLHAYDAQGDLSKFWFISYYFKYPESDEYKRFRETDGINRFSSLKERREALYVLKNMFFFF